MDEQIMRMMCDETYLRNQNEWFTKLRNIFEGDDVGPIVLRGVSNWYFDPNPVYGDVEEMLEKDFRLLAGRMENALRDDQFRPACIEKGFYGVHFVDRIFGAEVYFKSGQWYNKYLRSEVGELKVPDLENDETWALARRYATAFFKNKTTVPLFGLPTIASAF